MGRLKNFSPIRLWLIIACVVILLASIGAVVEQDAQAGPQNRAATSAGESTQGPAAAADESGDAADTEPVAADEGDADEEPVAEEPNWMDKVDGVFGTYLVTPMAKVLFFDFGTKKLQLHLLRKQDGDGDGMIARTEARGRASRAFDKLDKDGDGLLSEEEFTVLAPSIPAVVVWLLFGGVFFTLRMSFINIRGFWHAIRLTKGDYDDPNEKGEVSHFQALSSALSATVGLGNIAGVAIAVGTGGPGAIFWLILAGLFGMSSKFAECTLGQMYRKVAADGTVSGGPMHYLRDGLRDMRLGWLGAILATVYAIVCMGASFGGGCTFQVGQSREPVQQQIAWFMQKKFQVDGGLVDQHFPWIYGLIMVVLVGVVIIGGIRRIAATASKIVPLMCSIYVLMALFVLGANYHEIIPAFRKIISMAFTDNAVLGGFLGVAVIGIKRAVFSNEAGIGSASIAHAAAKTDEPVSEGIVALLEPFIDTVVVCTMTGLVIVITGVYDDPQYAGLVDADNGAALTASALESVSIWFPRILCLAVMLFAYSTMISWSYYGERCWSLLFGSRSSIIYKCLFLCFVFLGSIVTPTNVLVFSDLMILSLAFPNILGVIMLSGRVRRALDRYWARYKSGEMEPVEVKV